MDKNHNPQVEESGAYKHIIVKLQNTEEKEKNLEIKQKTVCLPKNITIILAADFLLATKYYRKKNIFKRPRENSQPKILCPLNCHSHGVK